MYYWSHFALLMGGLLIFVYTFFWLMKRHQKKKVVKKEPTLNCAFDTNSRESEIENEEEPYGFAVKNVASIISQEAIIPSLSTQEQVKPVTKVDDIISLTVMAKIGERYSGYELLQALLTSGFRYGAMNVFHRHENLDGSGDILFSLAQAVAPGSFDLSDVGAISCPGLTLFMELNKQTTPLATLDLMVDTAKQLVEDLGGVIYDDSRRPLSLSSVEKWRAQISAFQAL